MSKVRSEYETPSRIIRVQFSLLSPEEILKNSVAEITRRETYMGGMPVDGGLFDPRMGVLEPGMICPTDGLTHIDTPGYFGHIELGRPVFFIQHIKEIMKVLKCVCFKCSKLLIDKTQHSHILEYSGEKRWEYMQTAMSKRVSRCGDQTGDGCGCLQPDKIKLEGMATLQAHWSRIQSTAATANGGTGTASLKLTPEIVLKILRRISDEDVNFVGFSSLWSRPEWMICQILPVPPPAVRPSVKLDAQQRSEDDLTHIYINIIKTNNDLKNKINENANPNVIEGLTLELQYLIAMIANNKVKGASPIAQRNGRPLQCIMGRLNFKNGRIRGNLMGKRVDFSARSVITGDPNLSVRQLGVPMKIAMNITKPITVNDLTHEFLTKLVQNGPDVYPGAKILERKSGERISLRYVDRNSIVLRPGDVIHRHMMDGDYVLFNRQPSLHRMSMMCHEVKVMRKGDTFRMNVANTKPYNADFDGDEMNMHMAQNTLAETELRLLASTVTQIVSPSSNVPIIAIYQDSLLGSYRLTREGVKFSPRDAMNLLMMYPNVNPTTLFARGRKDVTNFELISQIMPPLTLKYKTKLWDADRNEDPAVSNNVLEIYNGRYIRGQIDKSVLGGGSKGIIHRICNDYGKSAAADFIDNMQNIVTEYMKVSSYSVGVSDLMSNRETYTRIIQAIQDKELEVSALIQKLHAGAFENNTSFSNKTEFEAQVNNVLNDATKKTDEISRQSLNPDNRFLMIVNSGSKGSLLNISHMISCLGQVNVDSKRVPYGFDSRTLPHFCKFDDSPGARGFIKNSYIGGLNAHELFFHAMGGRIGLIDTAVKTSQTGYIQRRLIKGLEDLKVDYDLTVRNSNGKVIQFSYGEDAFDPMFVENQSLPIVTMSTQDIYMHYDMATTEKSDSDTISTFNKGASARMGKQKDELRKVCKKYIDLMLESRDLAVKNIFKNKNVDTVLAPVAFIHIINNIQGNLGLAANSIVDITPLEAFQLIDEYYAKLESLHYAPPNKLFETLYFYYLNPRELLIAKRFHRKGLILLLETVLLKYKQALIQPGEMVGVVAGQSIGEPTTQLTLNSFVYETEILVRDEKGVVSSFQIGDFAKWGIETTSKMEYMTDKDTTYAELSKFYEVPSATEDGNTVWRRIEAVTKHPVINEDGSNTMLKVTTKGNREIIATKAKSFLQLIDGKIQGVNGSELKVGDYLPVSMVTYKLATSLGLLDDIYTIERSDLQIPNIIGGELVMEPREGRCSDLEFDQIVSIEEVPNTTDYAYDLTVEETRTFDCINGVGIFDTFHTAGVASKSNVTRGVPRIEEILRLTKNPKHPSMTVFLKTADESNPEKAKQFANMMEHTKLGDVASSVQICFDPDEFNTRIKEDRALVEQYYEFTRMLEDCNGGVSVTGSEEGQTTKSKWIVRMEMDTETLLDKNITMDDIHFTIKNGTNGQDVDCVYADYNSDKLVFRVRMSNIVSAKKRKGAAEPLDQTDEIHILKKFQDDLLSNTVLRGVSGIKNVLPRKLNNMVSKIDGKYEKKETWVLDTTGSNLLETLGLDYIDSIRTHSNDIREMFNVLGIEAARQIIHDEIVDVLEFSGAYANYHHLSLLCDRMTTKKDLVSIFRTGLFSDDIGPIAKATFEVHTEVLLDAARFGEADNMRGVSANVMCGQPGYYGTNAFQLVLDMNEMAKLSAQQVSEKEPDPMNELLGHTVDDSDVCSRSKIEIQNNIGGMKRADPGLCDDDYNAGF